MPKKEQETSEAKAIYEDWGVEPYDQNQEQAGGLSPGQRFIIALLLFVIVLVIGFSCLVLTGKVWLL